ncbi:MAG: ImmA/IrrE family metallo-endopeptidase [Bacteroidota bacterium]
MNQIINAAQAARDLLSDVGWDKPGDLTLEEIAGSIGAIIKEEPLGGSEGRILIKGNSAVINLNSSISNVGKRNFVLAHEIGHFLLHKDLKLFVDNFKTLSEWHVKGIHEQQANQFAEELLIPQALFISMVKGKRLNLALIEQVAAFFSASLTATFIRYSRLGDFPMMIVYIEDGVIRWKMPSKDFPFQYLAYGSKVPSWTVAGDFFNGKSLEKIPVKIEAIEWFPDDYKLQNNENWKLWEQCYQVSPNGLISCLWSF